jgi:hypothetical protein
MSSRCTSATLRGRNGVLVDCEPSVKSSKYSVSLTLSATTSRRVFQPSCVWSSAITEVRSPPKA